ncbi:hypothetical protein QUB68_14475 [Microcoleus sp. A006_D1]|uniref:hypothetical protein n=1 Tax=Microcoleus sp. A006_D1 TaxID=3055267 RepID=UPI002FD288BA
MSDCITGDRTSELSQKVDLRLLYHRVMKTGQKGDRTSELTVEKGDRTFRIVPKGILLKG